MARTTRSIPHGARIFRRNVGRMMHWIKNEHLAPGATADLEEHETMTYDHRDQEVLRGIDFGGKEFFLLKNEIEEGPTVVLSSS